MSGKIRLVRQEQRSECGHACVTMIANFHGHQIDLFSLRQLAPPPADGISLAELTRVIDTLDLQSRAIKISLDELETLEGPSILHWNMNHFVVLHKASKDELNIYDPAAGFRKITKAEAATCFTGIAVEINKKIDFHPLQLKNSIQLMDLFKLIHKASQSLLSLFILSLLIELFCLLNPLFIQYVTDTILTGMHLANLYVLGLGFILLSIGHAFTEYLRSSTVIFISNKLCDQLTTGLVSHLLKLPLDFFERRSKGDLLSRFQAINEIQKKLTTDSINAVLDGLVIILNLTIMFFYSWLLTLIVLIGLSLYLGLRLVSYHYLNHQNELSIREHANEHSRFLEILHSMMPIKIFAKEGQMLNRWRNPFIKALNADVRIAKTNTAYQVASIFLLNLEQIIILCLGAQLTLSHQLSAGMLIAFLAFRQLLVNKSSSLIQKLIDYKLIQIQLNRMADLILETPEPSPSSQLIIPEIKGSMTIKNLGFGYQTENPLFTGLDLTINAGEKVVIKGASGLGKTTLLKLMMGLLEADEGEILIDNIPIRLLGPTKYRALYASVMQADTLISGSILENIAFLEPVIDLERIYFATQTAQIHDSIMKLTMGYETLIGDMGSTLSGGQKQRLLLARALYKQPKILFLDEATSHLDVETEFKINQALKTMKMTQISVAHRMESIAMADRVIDLGR